MAIKLDCPRCKTPLQVPNSLAGGYVNCPHCKGRLWVDRNAPADATPANAVAVANTGSMSIAATSPGPRPPVTPTAGEVAVRPPPPTPPKRVARFIAAETSDSSLPLAADGKLPELHLDQRASSEKPDATTRSINPLAVAGLLGMSIVLSIVLVLMDVGAPTVSGAQRKAAMRQKIEDQYFGSGTLDAHAKNLELYQVLLREAQQAYTRGDHRAEREDYRRVLDMLRAERGAHDEGLTGSHAKDKELEDAILILLSGR
jgi:hypothetical protein